MASPAPAPAQPVGRVRLWLGVLLAPGAWVFVEGVGYVVAARMCAPALAGGVMLRLAVHLIICAVGLVAAVAGLRISLTNHQRLRLAARSADTAIAGRASFMATSGVLLSMLFIGGIVLFALPAFFLHVCQRTHG